MGHSVTLRHAITRSIQTVSFGIYRPAISAGVHDTAAHCSTRHFCRTLDGAQLDQNAWYHGSEIRLDGVTGVMNRSYSLDSVSGRETPHFRDSKGAPGIISALLRFPEVGKSGGYSIPDQPSPVIFSPVITNT